MSSEVQLYIYDISGGLAKQMSLALIGKQIDGIWHTAIVVYGQEYFFGSDGISNIVPGTLILGPPNQIIKLGSTKKTKEALQDYLKKQGSSTFHGAKYDLFKHNCNNFSNELAKFLVGKPIPAHITSLPSDILNSPFGPFIKPYLDQLGRVAEGNVQSSSTKKKDKNNHAATKDKLILHKDNLSTLTQEPILNLLDTNKTNESLAAQELFQFVSDLPHSGDTWCIGPDHIALLDDADQVSSAELGLAIVDCFRFAVCHSDDVLLALLTERNHCLTRLLERIRGKAECKLSNVITKLLCNCIYGSFSWSLDEENRLPSSLIVEICIQSLENENSRYEALSLAKNISLGIELSDEDALQLGSYLLHLCSEKDLVTSTDSRNQLYETIYELLCRYPDLVELGMAHDLYLEDSIICRNIRNILNID